METLIPHNTTCVFCKAPFTAKVDPLCPGDRLVKLLPIGACNRCGDFRHSIRRIEDTIKRVCEELAIARETNRKDLPKMEEKIRQGLNTLTHNLMYRLCKHYRLDDCWEQEFMDLLFDKPKYWRTILDRNENGLRTLKKFEHLPNRNPSAGAPRPRSNDP